MMRHRIRLRFYDYLEGSLAPEDHRSVERHLARCPRCARELVALKESVSLLAPARAAHQQAGEEPEWGRMVDSILSANAVLERLAAKRRPPTSLPLAIWLGAHQRRTALGAALAVAAVLLALLLPRGGGGPAEPVQTTAGQLADSIVNERVSRYFRTSRILLTELSNVSPRRAPTDMSPERRASRELLSEARFLRRQPLDEYSAGVISDVERIMLTMANLPDHDPEEEVSVLQEGVDHRNLLFRVRMAEQAYRSRTIVRASGTRQGGAP